MVHVFLLVLSSRGVIEVCIVYVSVVEDKHLYSFSIVRILSLRPQLEPFQRLLRFQSLCSLGSNTFGRMVSLMTLIEALLI